MGDCIGKGAYGSVYRGLNIENGLTVAIKQMDIEAIPKEDLDDMMSEVKLLRSMEHPNVVQYYDFIKTEKHLHIILEYMENGSLITSMKQVE